jgi:D-glycero-D-manno-heptose 1,7-bisphosphate phosphatase
MKVVLMDRDGTVVVEPTDFAVRLKGLSLFPDTLEAITKLAKAGYSVIFITNQISIAHGTLTLEEYNATNKKMEELLKPSGIKVLKVYVCPHAPEDNCVCRKPKPHMLQRAAKEFGFDLSQTFMIGDRVTDVEAGHAAGTKTILLEQGNFQDTTDLADFTAKDLLEAVDYILQAESDTI